MIIDLEQITFKDRASTGLYPKITKALSNLPDGKCYIFTLEECGTFKGLKPMAYQWAKQHGKKVSIRKHELGLAAFFVAV
jgi:hypothetical protein